MSDRLDALIVGGGIVGLATARALLRVRPGVRLAILEKESRLARHQTGRNSGVLHSGIYYRPGSQKAAMCVSGRLAMEQFCTEHDVPFDRCGKVIVAVSERELPRLEQLEARAFANGVTAERVGPERLRELEPHAAGIAALHVPDTGVIDFSRVADALGEEVTGAGADIHLGHQAIGVDERAGEIRVDSDRGDFTARVLVNCAGLQSDLVAAADGVRHDVQIVPFRGEFHELVPSAAGLVRHLIYPVPDPDLPFLGVHLSRGIDGGVHVGPNAVLALRREGYTWSARRASRVAPARDVSRILAHGAALLAGRSGRGVPLAQQARARARDRAPRTWDRRHRSRAVSRRRSRAGGWRATARSSTTSCCARQPARCTW